MVASEAFCAVIEKIGILASVLERETA